MLSQDGSRRTEIIDEGGSREWWSEWQIGSDESQARSGRLEHLQTSIQAPLGREKCDDGKEEPFQVLSTVDRERRHETRRDETALLTTSLHPSHLGMYGPSILIFFSSLVRLYIYIYIKIYLDFGVFTRKR